VNERKQVGRDTGEHAFQFLYTLIGAYHYEGLGKTEGHLLGTAGQEFGSMIYWGEARYISCHDLHPSHSNTPMSVRRRERTIEKRLASSTRKALYDTGAAVRHQCQDLFVKNEAECKGRPRNVTVGGPDRVATLF